MEIRLAKKEDQQAVTALMKEYVSEAGYMEEFKEELYALDKFFDDRCAFYVVTKQQQVIACGGFSHLVEDKSMAYIEHLFVTKDYRGKGIGSSLLNTLTQTARKYYQTLYIETHHRLNKGNRLFIKYSFTQIPYPFQTVSEFEKDSWYLKQLN